MLLRSLFAIVVFSCGVLALAQDEPTTATPSATADSATTDDAPKPKAPESLTTEQVQETAEKLAKTLDKDPRAKTAAAGILQPIYWWSRIWRFRRFTGWPLR